MTNGVPKVQARIEVKILSPVCNGTGDGIVPCRYGGVRLKCGLCDGAGSIVTDKVQYCTLNTITDEYRRY